MRPDKNSLSRPSEGPVDLPAPRLRVERHLKLPSAVAQSEQRHAHFSSNSRSEQCNQCANPVFDILVIFTRTSASYPSSSRGAVYRALTLATLLTREHPSPDSALPACCAPTLVTTRESADSILPFSCTGNSPASPSDDFASHGNTCLNSHAPMLFVRNEMKPSISSEVH